MKLKALQGAIVSSDHVRFVEVDFTDPGGSDGFQNAGFDNSVKTIFVWEGVTLYLSEADVRTTIATLRSIAAPNSVIILDIYGNSFLRFANKGAAGKVLEATGESVGFGLDFSQDHDTHLQEFMASLEVKLGQRRYLGAETTKGPFVVIAALILYIRAIQVEVEYTNGSPFIASIALISTTFADK
jgi:O-methyltransferase involved in polyketide biosynthesis